MSAHDSLWVVAVIGAGLALLGLARAGESAPAPETDVPPPPPDWSPAYDDGSGWESEEYLLANVLAVADLKEGANVSDLKSEMLWVIPTLAAIVQDVTGTRMVITAGYDLFGHTARSLHYEGEAIDIRTRDFTYAQRSELMIRFKIALAGVSEFYHVLREDDKPCIHVSYSTDGRI